MDVASASINTNTASSSAEGNMVPVDMAETSISSLSAKIAPDLQQSRIHKLIEDAVLFINDAEEETTEELDSQTVFDDWMLTLMKHQHKMLTVLLYCSFQNRKNEQNECCTRICFHHW